MKPILLYAIVTSFVALVSVTEAVGGDSKVALIPDLASLRTSLPDGETSIVFLEGVSSPGDGGEGIWKWDARSLAADNGGTIVRPNTISGSGRWKRVHQGALRPEWFGAQCGMGFDSTAAFSDALLAISTDGGGVLDATNCRVYKANIKVVGVGIQIKFGNFSYNTAGAAANVVAADPSKPVLQIGDGSATTQSIVVSNFSFHGDGASARDGVLILGAGWTRLQDCSVRDFVDYQVMDTSTPKQPSPNNYLDHCDIATAPVSSSFGLVEDYGGAYATPLFVSNSTLNGERGSSYIVSLHGYRKSGEFAGNTQLYMTNTWVQTWDGQGIYFGDPYAHLYADNTMIDSPNTRTDGPDRLITFADNTYIETHVSGTLTCDCSVTMPAGETAAITGRNLLPRGSMLQQPIVNNQLCLADSNAPFHQQYGSSACDASVFRGGSNAFLANKSGAIIIAPKEDNSVLLADAAQGRPVPLTFGRAGVGATIFSGSGIPKFKAPVGSLYLRLDGGTRTTLYVREPRNWEPK